MRSLHKYVASLGVASCVVAYAVGASPVSERQASQETDIAGLRLVGDPAPDARLDRLGIYFGYLEEDTNPGGGKYFCGALSHADGVRTGAIIARGLRHIPDAALEKLRLRYVILCSEMRAIGRRIGGIPVPPLDLLMLNVGDGTRTRALEHGCLHELYHLTEYRFHSDRDREWDERFGGGYVKTYAGFLENPTIGSGGRGFLNAYATTFPHEERAELFASLLLAPDEVARYIDEEGDARLRSKARFVADKARRLLGLRIPVP
jgi:hypothetical protein